MTNKLEKQFFQCFGIEPYKEIGMIEYPQISDRILLELICIALNTFETFEINRIMNIESLKKKILNLLILAQDDVYSQVRTLFEEG